MSGNLTYISVMEKQIPLEGLTSLGGGVQIKPDTSIVQQLVKNAGIQAAHTPSKTSIPDNDPLVLKELDKIAEILFKNQDIVKLGFVFAPPGSLYLMRKVESLSLPKEILMELVPQCINGRFSVKLRWMVNKIIEGVAGRKSHWYRVMYSKSGGTCWIDTWPLKKDVSRVLAALSSLSPESAGSPENLVVDDALRIVDDELKVLKGEKMHCATRTVIRWVKTQKPIWLWGPPASGKNVMAEQIARVLEVGFYPIYLGPTTTESKIVGFMNAGAGTYVTGLCYEPYKNGGLIYWDEIDVADPQVLVAINSLVENDGYRFPNGEFVKRHDKLYLVAGANTKGFGAEAGLKRNSQDAATLSRFIKVHLPYDENLERSLCRDRGWVTYVQRVRKFVHGLARGGVPITPRASYKGDKALEMGLSKAEVAEACLFSDMNEDTKQAVVKNCGTFV